MIKLAITSNIKKYYKGYIDFIDHYWLAAFEKLNISYSILPNNIKLSKKILINNELLILSGGNDILSNKKESVLRNKVEKNLIKEAIKLKIPIMGICRGAQLVNLFFDGKIRKIESHMRSRHNLILNDNKILKDKIINVNSFHSYGIASGDLSKKFDTIGIDIKGNIEMFKHKKKMIICTMWHPEREINLKILKKLINYIKK